MVQNKLFELSFQGPEPEQNTAQVNLVAEFSCGEKCISVKGFYDGGGTYKVRFLPEEAGEYSWRVSGVVTAEGSALCEKDPAYHGKVTADGLHFRFADGERFLPFGTTVYALAHQPDELVEKTLTTLGGAPFNKVRMCVFPKHFGYNENEPPVYPFEKKENSGWDVRRPCMDFWQRFDRILDRLEEMGVQIDLILFHPYDNWGFATLTQEENLIYLDTVIRRLAARPGIWWSMANEYDVCGAKSLEDWFAIEEYIAANDPFHHLLSNHNCYQPWDAARPNITHVSMQTKTLNRVGEWQEKYGKPVVVDECCYEGNLPVPWGNISGFEMVSRFWKAFVTGGYCTHGETFLDDQDILWWAKGGELHGESPARIAFLREIAENLPGPVENLPDHLATAADPKNREMVLAKIPYLPEDLRGMFKALFSADPKELEYVLDGDRSFQGHVGDEAFLTYFDRHCCAKTEVELPDTGSYIIEVIDTWEMTRTTAASGVHGRVEITLPGKEGMAVLARRVA